MKADLSLPENRAAFAALYYPLPVRYEDGVYKEITLNYIKWVRWERLKEPLHLRPISSLTEEELLKLWGIVGNVTSNERSMRRWLDHTFTPLPDRDNFYVATHMEIHVANEACDLLRSVGILIPYRGNSCEEIIEAGLAVYRKEGE